MHALFKLLGVLLVCYVIQALVKGSVYAKSRPWGRTFHRDENAWAYWSAVTCYSLLSIALLFVF